MREFTEQELVRREKLDFLREKGIDPFGKKYDVNTTTKDLKEEFESSTTEELDELKKEVSIAGRIMTKRGKGKAGFINLQDKYGQIQIYVRQDVVGEDEYALFKKADLFGLLCVRYAPACDPRPGRAVPREPEHHRARVCGAFGRKADLYGQHKRKVCNGGCGVHSAKKERILSIYTIHFGCSCRPAMI